MILHPTRGALRSHHDRQLSEARAREIARHLEGCSRCRARLAEIGAQAQRVRGLFEALDVESVPLLDLAARTPATADLERAPYGGWAWLGRPLALPAPAWIAAALALVLLGTLVRTRPTTAPDIPVPETAPVGRLVVVAQRGPTGRESRTLSLTAGNYRFIEEPTVHTGP
jgi:anti-sigma factor RsiW